MRTQFYWSFPSVVVSVVCVLLFCPSPAYAECPAVLGEAPPLGDPPHSAQAMLNQQDSCPPITKISAVLHAGEEILSNRSYYDEAISNPPLVFPVTDSLSLPNVAGLYRLEWLTEFTDGTTQTFTQTFTVPCPAPKPFDAAWSDADRKLLFTAPPGDACEGETTATLSLSDISGEFELDPISTTFRSNIGLPVDVSIDIPLLPGERRYSGSLLLQNASKLTTQIPVEFITGCGALVPNATILNGRMVGGVQASECQYPINMKISAVHESGEVIQEVDAILMEDSFDFELPKYETWPAGNYTVQTQFIGAATRARLNNDLSIACIDPVFSEPSLELSPQGNSADVVFEIRGRDTCQKETTVSLQVRDSDRIVVFNRSLDLPPATGRETFRWPFLGIPGSTYELALTADFGLNQQDSTTESGRSVYECTAPQILHFGYSSPDATHASALVALTTCNAPASAKLVVRNEEGRVVLDSDPQIVQDAGTAYARVAPISLGHLDSGNYKATLTVADNRSRTSTVDIDLVRDVDGPQISVLHEGIQLTQGELPTVRSLDELSLVFSDTSAPMESFVQYSETPTVLTDDASATILRIDGEATPQMWITGNIDLPRSHDDWGFVGVLTRGQSGNQWLAPISRSYVPSSRPELADFHPSRMRTGFRSVARVQPLEAGRYDVLGVVIAGADGEHRLIPSSGSFNISTLSAQQHDAILRQGVTEFPIALSWSSDNTAVLERVTSVPDGDYTFSAIGRDVYGNASDVHSLVVRIDQQKQRAQIEWPAIVGYKQSFQHRFREDDATSRAPLRVLYRRIDGYGNIRINDRDVSEQTTEDVLQPDQNGVFTVAIELLDEDVDAKFVLHADSTDAKPLELSVRTFLPEFVTQRSRTQTTDTLTIKYSPQPCRHIVFDDLSQVSLRANEVLCAVRLNIPKTSVLSTTDERSLVRLPQGVATDALYEEGFVRVSDGMPTFQPTRQIPIREMQAYSSTPQVEFVPLPQWRTRAKDGQYLTSVGDSIPGHLVFRPGLAVPIIYVDGERIDIPDNTASSIRIPVTTSTNALGDSDAVSVRAHYPDTPDLEVTKRFEFHASPPSLYVEAVGGDFVSPGPLSLDMKLRAGDGRYSVEDHGSYELANASLFSRDRADSLSPDPDVQLNSDGSLRASFSNLQPGVYRLQLNLDSTDPRFVDHLAAVKTETTFEVLDGSQVAAGLFTFRATDKTPFFGQISVDYFEDDRRHDVSTVAWEVSDDGTEFLPLQCCGHSVDFALTDPGAKYYRAQLTNRHSGETSYTESIKINAFLSGRLEVEGPRQTFRGFPAEYSVKGLPEGYEVLWRVTNPNTSDAIEIRSSTLTIASEETGTYVVEVVADTAADSPDAVSALRTFFTLDCSWPRIPESVIAGPTKVEYGKVSTFTVTHPPIFDSRGNPTVKRVGEWEMPDGTRVQDDEWAQFILREMPQGYSAVDVLYHTWLEGDPTTLTTAVHRIEPISYRWPNWRLKVATNSIEPPALLRLSVTPEEWKDWMGLGDSPITTHWDLPDYVRVINRTPTEAFIHAVDDREFDVRVRVSDPRGNVTELEKLSIRPLKQIPFEISLHAVASRTLHTAPLDITAKVDPIVLPKGRGISRVAFYINGLYAGVSDGSPIDLQLRTPGEHRIRAIASIDNEFTADDTITLNIGENHQAQCNIVPVGDFRRNGLAKAECDDPDGHMVEYRWYANGQLLSDSGTRVQLTNAGRLGLNELSLIAVDNAGIETTARYVLPPE